MIRMATSRLRGCDAVGAGLVEVAFWEVGKL